jgi:hypothetical protein
MSMAKTLNRPGRKPGDMIDDRGCRYAPTCAGCPWRECVWTLPPAERKIFSLAYRTLATFKAPPDEGIA